MNFDELDRQMRLYETARDICAPPDVFLVARIDGRNFSRLTKELCDFDAPFDERFQAHMAETVRHLMNCGFKTVYGYTESDEISILFDPGENTFGRKHRKYNSVLAGEASAVFSINLQRPAAFDCRLCELPDQARVVDYFRWRAADARRNALNAHCYWGLRLEGLTPQNAAARLDGLTVEEKQNLLRDMDVDFDSLPGWQTMGTGFYWALEDKEGLNPVTHEKTMTTRRRLKTDMQLPQGDAYGRFIQNLLDAAGQPEGGPR